MYVLVKTPTSATEKSKSYTFNDVYDLLTFVAAAVKSAAHPAKKQPLTSTSENVEEQEHEEKEEQEEEEQEEEQEEQEEEEQEKQGTLISTLEAIHSVPKKNYIKTPTVLNPVYPNNIQDPPASMLENTNAPLYTGPIDREKNNAEIMERIKQMETGRTELESQVDSLDKVTDYFRENFLTIIEVNDPILKKKNPIFTQMPILINRCYDLFVNFPHKFIQSSHEFETLKKHIHNSLGGSVIDTFGRLLCVSILDTHGRILIRKPITPYIWNGNYKLYALKPSVFVELESMVSKLIDENAGNSSIPYKDAVDICYKTLTSIYNETLTSSILEDWIALFVKSKLNKTDNGSLKSSLMYSTFEQWLQTCAPEGMTNLVSIQNFSKIMKEKHGFETNRKSAGVFYKNVEWKSDTCVPVVDEKTVDESTTKDISGWDPQSPFENSWARIGE